MTPVSALDDARYFSVAVATNENIAFEEVIKGQPLHEISDYKGYGMTFGWDVWPNRMQSWLLGTNLRWFPDLKLDIEDGQSISFYNIEFTLFSLSFFPAEYFKSKTKGS